MNKIGKKIGIGLAILVGGSVATVEFHDIYVQTHVEREYLKDVNKDGIPDRIRAHKNTWFFPEKQEAYLGIRDSSGIIRFSEVDYFEANTPQGIEERVNKERERMQKEREKLYQEIREGK